MDLNWHFVMLLISVSSVLLVAWGLLAMAIGPSSFCPLNLIFVAHRFLLGSFFINSWELIIWNIFWYVSSIVHFHSVFDISSYLG